MHIWPSVVTRQVALALCAGSCVLIALQSFRLVTCWRKIKSWSKLVNVLQAYEGLQTVLKLRQEYVFIPSKVKEVH